MKKGGCLSIMVLVSFWRGHVTGSFYMCVTCSSSCSLAPPPPPPPMSNNVIGACIASSVGRFCVCLSGPKMTPLHCEMGGKQNTRQGVESVKEGDEREREIQDK